MDQCRITEAKVNGGRPTNSIERAIQRGKAITSCLLRSRLHVRLVDLNDVRAGHKEIFYLCVDRSGVIHRKFFFVLVVVVLSLLRHRVWTGHGDSDSSIRVGAEKFHIAYFDRMLPANLSDNARHRIRMTATIERCPRVIDVDALERRGKPIGVTLAPDLAIGDDVESRTLLIADGEDRRIVLRFLEKLRSNAP